MKKSYDQTFRLTTGLVAQYFPQACNPQSALATVCSVECGLFA